MDRLSENCQDFVNTCLHKDVNQRPKYQQLLKHPFLEKAKEARQAENVTVYLSDVIDGLRQNTDKFQLFYYLPQNLGKKKKN